MKDKLADARAHHQAGRLDEADALYREVLAAEPDNAEALNLSGVLAFQAGRGEEAVAMIERAIALDPSSAKALNNLGNVLMAGGRTGEALARYQAALGLDADLAEAHAGLAGALRTLGRGADAAESYRSAVRLMPDRSELHFNLANTLKDLGRAEEAVESFEAALGLKPDFFEARVNLGAALSEAGRLDDAADAYELALGLRPDDPDVLGNLGLADQERGRFRDSAEYFDKALALDPANRRTANNALHALLYDPDLGNDALHDAVRRTAAANAGAEAPPAPAPALASASALAEGERLRVGYLSSDFRVHPVGLNLAPLLAHHDREKFEVFCYSQLSRPDDLTKEFKTHAEHWREIGGLADAGVAELIRADNIHLCVYVGGHFDDNRPWVAGLRPAPVQVSFHGGTTTGLDEMDCWLTDAILHPGDTPERFTEDLVRLPNFYAYPAQDNAPEVSALPAETNGFITFVSFNKPCKMNESVLDLWSGVLKAVPDSRLVLKYRNTLDVPSIRQRFLGRFEANGIAADRIELRSAADSFERHLAGYHGADIALDTFPFAGATTTFQALWMGVPVISLMGDRFIGRAGGSISTHAGLGEFVTDTPQAYIEKAAALAADGTRLGELRAGLRQRVAASPLCDGPAYARAVETAFMSLWDEKTGGGS